MNLFNLVRDKISLTDRDIFLISYPKSGNTRFRMAIAKYLCLKYNLSSKFDYEFVNDILPEIGKGNIGQAKSLYKDFENFPLFIKSHQPYKRLQLFIKSSTQKVIYVHRKNPETLMSYYDYSKSRGIIRDVSFSDFLRSSSGLQAFIESLKGWTSRAPILISYQSLIEKDIDTILYALDSLNIVFDRSIMEEAIITTRREKVIQIENKFDTMEYNFAEKRKRIISNYFTAEDIKYYNKIAKDILPNIDSNIKK